MSASGPAPHLASPGGCRAHHGGGLVNFIDLPRLRLLGHLAGQAGQIPRLDSLKPGLPTASRPAHHIRQTGQFLLVCFWQHNQLIKQHLPPDNRQALSSAESGAAGQRLARPEGADKIVQADKGNAPAHLPVCQLCIQPGLSPLR